MTSRRFSRSVRRTVPLWTALACVGLPSVVFAQAKKGNPSAKVFVTDVSGEALINTGDSIQDLNKRSIYTAQGTTIETKKSTNQGSQAGTYSTMVYSNGTGAFFDSDTRVEVKRFSQEPFTPHRADMDIEPSISQTQAFVSRGTVGLCTSRLVAGSNMTYHTPHGAVNIRGKKVVIEATNDVTKISMLEGESTVRAGDKDMGGHSIKAGEQAIIRRGAAGQPNQIQIVRIPPAEVPKLDEKVAMACLAKKTVYFEQREVAVTTQEKSAETTAQTDEEKKDAAAEANAAATPAAGENKEVSAFYQQPTTGSGSGANAPGSRTRTETIAVPVVPQAPAAQYSVSPAILLNAPRPGGG